MSSRIDFTSQDGRSFAQIMYGRECVALQLRPIPITFGPAPSGIVLSSDEAKALGYALVRLARYSKEAAA